MPKNKKARPTLEELLERPWCYYCERDFDDLKILIDHQRHKHFKCERCGRRLNTAGGLSVHLNHVHKEQLGPIENALPNRASHEIEIFGTEGIPAEIAEAERRAATGNTPGGGPPAKKPKFESPAEMKKRLAEHRAKKAEEAVDDAADAPPAPPVQPAAVPPAAAGYAAAATYAPVSYPPAPFPPAAYVPPPFPPAFPPAPAAYAPPFPAPYAAPAYAYPPPGLPQRPAPPEAPAPVPAPAEPEPEEREKKKDKNKVRMVYADDDLSPEEKMAQLPRYAQWRQSVAA